MFLFMIILNSKQNKCKNWAYYHRKLDIGPFVWFELTNYPLNNELICEDYLQKFLYPDQFSLYLFPFHCSRFLRTKMQILRRWLIISVISKKKIQKMNELYTFNSQQFQAVENRPASTDHPPNLRKRIISTKYSPKPSELSRASTREQVHSSNDNKFKRSKRVTFLEDNQFSRDETANQRFQSSLKKTRSMAHKEIRENLFKDQSSTDLEQRYQYKPANRNDGYYLRERSMSTEEKAVKQIMTKKHAEMVNSKAGTGRQRRILSLKLSPKIVPISQRKLPKAFKIDYSDQYSLPKIQRKDKGILQKINKASQLDPTSLKWRILQKRPMGLQDQLDCCQCKLRSSKS